MTAPIPRRFRHRGMVPHLTGHRWLRRVCDRQERIAAFGGQCWRTTEAGRTAVAELAAALERAS